MIPWVDGADPAWLAEKQRYSPKEITENNAVNRYRDWGLLPYWFRAVEQCMPWVRTVHFVTWGHIPTFMNTGAERLHIVRHEDFIPPEYLPTFSSHVIEMNLHRISDLSEYFVYFNDDQFPLRPMKQEQFFRDGLPCTCGMEVPIKLIGSIGTWQHAIVNDLGLVNAHFSKRAAVKNHGWKYRTGCYRWKDNIRTLALEKLYPDQFLGFENIHGPAAYLKTVFCKVWEKEPETLKKTCQDRFRTSDNLNQWVFLWWQVASGQFSPSLIDNYVDGINDKTIGKLCQIIQERRHDFICLNDPEEEVPFERLAQQLRNAFEKIFPEKSAFEK